VDQLAEMRAWLDREGIRVAGLRALRVLAGRITFERRSPEQMMQTVFARPSIADELRSRMGAWVGSAPE
jgi:hypothetical protein